MRPPVHNEYTAQRNTYVYISYLHKFIYIHKLIYVYVCI